MEIVKIKEAMKKIEEAEKFLRGASIRYDIEILIDAYEYLMEEVALFKVKERVKLHKTPNITEDNSPGWMCAKHFLIKGAKGTVITAEYYERKFRYGIEFDDESYINHKNKVVPIKPNHTYTFEEKALRITAL